MINKEESTKMIYFKTPGGGILVLGRVHISNLVKISFFLKTLLFIRAYNRKSKYI